MNGEFPLQIHFKIYLCTCIKHKFDSRHQGCLMGPSNIGFDFFVFSRHFQQYFSYVMATSFSGGSWSTRREPPTMGKQLVNFITCGCESSAPFFVIYKLVIDLYELLDPTT